MLFFISKKKYEQDISEKDSLISQLKSNTDDILSNYVALRKELNRQKRINTQLIEELDDQRADILLGEQQLIESQKEFRQVKSDLDAEKKKNKKYANILSEYNKVIPLKTRKAIMTTADIFNRLKDAVTTYKKQQADEEELKQSILIMQKELDLYNDQAMFITEYGLYEPTFDFANSTLFKDKLAECRKKQKDMLKKMQDNAKNTSWKVNGSQKEGAKMVKETTKLLMKAYNGECDDIVKKVRSSNVSKSLESIVKRADNVNRLGATLGISIPEAYIWLKEEEVRLAYEYAVMKDKEREEIKEAKAREAEERKIQKEIEAKKKELAIERKKYLQEIERMKEQAQQIQSETPSDTEPVTDIEKKIQALEEHVGDIDTEIEKSEELAAANKRAGYVYIISNIGSFGRDVYKIGLTRRLDPLDRIKELSGASVPFPFDIHALIFSEDAPALEAALHRHFDDAKMNLVNPRKEFFTCSIDEIKEVVVANYDKTVDFVDEPEADQYYTTLAMRKAR